MALSKGQEVGMGQAFVSPLPGKLAGFTSVCRLGLHGSLEHRVHQVGQDHYCEVLWTRCLIEALRRIGEATQMKHGIFKHQSVKEREKTRRDGIKEVDSLLTFRKELPEFAPFVSQPVKVRFQFVAKLAEICAHSSKIFISDVIFCLLQGFSPE